MLFPGQPQQWDKRALVLNLQREATGYDGLSSKVFIVKVFLAE